MYSCDSCTLCCKYLAVEELEKQEHTWCQHCKIGHGCEIYDSRPESCRAYECAWLKSKKTNNPMPFSLRPDKSRIIIGTANHGDDIILYVSPDRPDAWKDTKLNKLIAWLKNKGIPVFVRCGKIMKQI